jgi:hypothetical protein
MTISMYNASIPIFKQMLGGLNAVLGKANAYCDSNKMNPNELLQAKLFPDMFHLIRQVQIASDFAKGVSARLAGVDVPSYEDTETSFEELQARITKTLAFITHLTSAQIDGSEAREIVTQSGTPKEKRFTGQTYLLHYGLPHFYFHVTAAYAILRNNGVEIGKRDYIGIY